jgi:hypothetical protein
MRIIDNESNDLDLMKRLSKESTTKSFIDNDLLAPLRVLAEIVPETCAQALDDLFYAWISGEGASDDLSSPKERELIWDNYRKLKELLTIL